MAEIDTLQVKITANANSATKSLQALATALNKVKNALNSVKGGVTVSDQIAKSLNSMNGALNTLSTGGVKKLQKLSNALNDYSDALERLKKNGAGALSNIKAVERQLSSSNVYHDAANDVDVNKFAPNVLKEIEQAKRIAAWKSSVIESDFTADDFLGMNEPRSSLAMALSGSARVDQQSGRFSNFFGSLRNRWNIFSSKDAASDVNVDKYAKFIEKTGEEIEKTGEKAHKAAGFFNKFIKSIGRIMLYRAIRSALKAIGEAFSEGLKNAYGYSKTSETFTRLADTLDRITSLTSQLKNQLGALWGELKQLALPVVESVVNALRFAAEYLTELFAALNGEDTYLRATYETKAWDETIGKVKEYKHQLLGLDELNNLSSKSANGKGATTDYSKMYEEVDVDSRMKKIAGVINNIKFAISDVLFDWSNLTGHEIEEKLVAGLLGVAGYLFTGSVAGAVLGTLAGVGIKMIVDTLKPAEKGRVYDEPTLFEILYPALTGLAGGIIGFKYGGSKGAFIGMTVGAALGMTINELLEFGNGIAYGEQDLFNLIRPALYGLAGAWIGFEIGKSGGAVGGLKGALVGLTIGATVGFIMNSFDPAEAAGDSVAKNVLFKMLKPALTGLAGAWIGWKIGKVEGALIGATIGLGVGFLLEGFLKAKNDGSTVKGFLKSIMPVLNGLAVGLLTFVVSKNAKASLVTGSIAATLTFVLQELDSSAGKGKKYDKSGLYNLFAPSLISMGMFGAFLGFKLGGVAGALVGFTLGCTITWTIKEMDVDRGSLLKYNNLFQVFQGTGTIKKGDPTTGGIEAGVTIKYDKYGNKLEEQAIGGINKPGTLFYAGEAGPEFIGSMGNSSAVANTGQMTDAIRKAAYLGMRDALAESGNGLAGYEPATTDDLFIAMRKKATNYNRMTGNSAFA